MKPHKETSLISYKLILNKFIGFERDAECRFPSRAISEVLQYSICSAQESNQQEPVVTVVQKLEDATCVEGDTVSYQLQLSHSLRSQVMKILGEMFLLNTQRLPF